ncbi:MAG: hypothetical protein Ct9H300mP25_02270 [Acidobacteriota bacterium]|nr:MAG: hypothetical protein Ct9H300mP25_02270 [Acidobacteriota bacterium]
MYQLFWDLDAAAGKKAIAEALAERLGSVAPLPPDDPDALLAAFTFPGSGPAISGDIDAALSEAGVEEMTAKHHSDGRLVSRERCDYLRPTVVYCPSPDVAMAKKEYMFPFFTVVECEQKKMIASIGAHVGCDSFDPRCVI